MKAQTLFGRLFRQFDATDNMRRLAVGESAIVTGGTPANSGIGGKLATLNKNDQTNRKINQHKMLLIDPDTGQGEIVYLVTRME